MRFAVLGDIHSNKFALESVLEDIRTKKVDFVISTGDLVGYMPFPNEVIEMLRERQVLVVQGNHDKFIATSYPVSRDLISKMSYEQIQSNASAAFTNYVISHDNRRYLKNLPEYIKLNCSGFKMVVVHGSTRSIDEYLYEDKEILLRQSKNIDDDIVICGHTHIPYHLSVDSKHFINAGSVGKPKHGSSQAAYVIVNIEEGKVISEIIKVNYDIESMVKAIEENNMISSKLIPMLIEGF